MMRDRLRLSAALVLLASFPACKPPEPPKVEDFEAPVLASNLPPARIDLPLVQKLEGTLPPETHADGKMRIDGLMTRREKYFGKKIIVRGHLVEKYECPKDATRCQHPHGYLADTPAGGDKKLLLAGLTESVNEALEQGKEYVITGTFEQRTQDGFVASVGLLIFESAEGLVIPEEKDRKRR
jgi:hypothetical protein